MRKTSNIIFIISLAIILTAAALVFINQRYKTAPVDMPKFKNPNPVPAATSTGINPAPLPPQGGNNPTTTPPNTQNPSPKTLLLSVPFTPQAPTANWDTIHNEDCEEASAIMANAYYNGPHDIKLDSAYVEGQLTKLTDWEMQAFGYNLDVTSEETVKMIEANYGLNTKILYSFTEQDIKKELAQNHLVLIPENGQLIGNPNYKRPGPKYHMLVIRGYTSTSIITNDPGTHNGLNYAYSFDTLYNANGDWDHQNNKVDLTKKNIIVVWQ